MKKTTPAGAGGLSVFQPINPRTMATLLAFVAFALVLSGCGTSSVRLMVVRPAVINAQPHGGLVTVGGLAAAHPAMMPAVGHLRTELKRQIVNSYKRVVRLTEYGGGLNIDGRLEDHGIVLTAEQRSSNCNVRVKKNVGGKVVTQSVSRPCVLRRTKWRSRVAVVMRVTNKEQVVLYLQRLVDTSNGQTPEHQGRAPLPDRNAILHAARLRMARKMAHIVVPHRVQVTATMHHCPGAAEKICEAAVAAFASSRYDAALMKYDRALEILRKSPDVSGEDIGEVHYNKSQVFKYSRRFDQAYGELELALKADPGNSAYQREFEAVTRERDRHHALVDQGLGAN